MKAKITDYLWKLFFVLYQFFFCFVNIFLENLEQKV